MSGAEIAPPLLKLYPFQREGVDHLIKRRCVLFGDEMGLGKTVQAAVAIQELFSQKAISRVLIVCPTSLSRNWRSELRKWAPDTRPVLYEGRDRHGMLSGGARVLIGSFETIANDLMQPTAGGKRFCDLGLDLIILDEAHRIKAPESQKARVLTSVLAARRWAITGTPLENHPIELGTIFRFLYPNDFSEEFSLEDHEQLLSYRDRTLVRRTRQQVGLQLPDKTSSTIVLGMNPAQAAEYEQTLSNIKESLASATDLKAATSVLLSGLQQLRKAAVISSDGDSSKIDLLEDEVEEIAARGEKVVVFSSFANLVLPEIQRRLRRHGALLYTGDMSVAERETAHQQFLTIPSALVMCASLRAAGVGLTWTVASWVYHVDMWWNPQAMLQAEDRVYRIGQKRQVFVKRLISEETLEEGIVSLQRIKQDIFDLLINESPIGNLETPNVETLLSLIGLKLAPTGVHSRMVHPAKKPE